jgi:hypothetical protein
MLRRTCLNVVAAAGVSLAAPTVAIAQVAPTTATPDPEGTGDHQHRSADWLCSRQWS